MYQAIGTPTFADLKAMIRMNLIRNNEVTTKDLTLTEKTFGQDVGTIKGKWTQNRPQPVIDNFIEIPEELLELHQGVMMSVDGLEVNELKFWTTISHELFYRTVQYLKNTMALEFKEKLEEVYKTYKKGTFRESCG